MQKNIRFLVCCVLLSCLIPQIAQTCSSIYLDSGSQLVFGYNVDFGPVEGEPFFIVNKRNVSKTALINSAFIGQQPASWTSKYGSITYNPYQEFPGTGINEAGLTVSTMALNVSVAPEPDPRPYVPQNSQWMQYLLDNFSTVQEVIESNSQIRPARNPLLGPMNHFLVGDRNGGSAVIEFLEGEMVYHTNETMPYKAITNNTYEQSLNLLSDYEGFGGSSPIPGHDAWGSLSYARFVKAVYRLVNYDGSDPVDYTLDTLEYIKNILPGSETTWSFVYDISNLRVYFHTTDNPTIRYFDLNVFDFSCETPLMFLHINADLSGDVSNDFSMFTQQLNQESAETYFQEVMPWFPPEDIEAAWQYPEEQTFCIPFGDLNGDGCVDRTDFYTIISEIRGPAPHDAIYDLNEDGNVNIADARYLVTLFSNPRGAACE